MEHRSTTICRKSIRLQVSKLKQPVGMEDAKSINSMGDEDLENANTVGENGGPDHLSEKFESMGSASGRCYSFTRIYQPPQHKPKEYPPMETLMLAYQSLGVVYGDLGTSPTQVLSSITITNLTEDDYVGILSLIIWSLTLFVLIKYVLIVLHADDHGEGGTFALYSTLCRHINFQGKLTDPTRRLESDATMTYYSRGSPLRSKTKNFIESNSKAQSLLTFVVLLGTCMVIGDGALTPATCGMALRRYESPLFRVLSALQGIQSRSSKITQNHVVFMAVVLFIILFAVQRCGTSKVSFSFTPIMLLWYVTNVSIGVYNIFKYQPSVLKAVSPHYIVKFFLRNGKAGWRLLGAIFLCITGAEALFADLGHFNKRAIQWAFSFVVYPAMILTYAGEAAYLIKNPDQIANAYYSSIPKPVYWPMFVISTLAAVIASQSMISATFSIVKQSVALDCFPRVHIIHTSSKHEGQVYCPEINYTLMILCIGLVIGAVVIWVMIITTCLATLVMLVIWETNIFLILGFFIFFISTEIIFLTSLLNKIPQGGWVPFAISAFFLTIMLSWRYGRREKKTYEAEMKLSLPELDHMLSREAIFRTPGICFFCTDLVNGIPPIIRQYINHTNSVREVMVIMTVRTLPVKKVLPEERFVVGRLGSNGVYRCLVQYGYKDTVGMEGDDGVAAIMAKLREQAEGRNEKRKLEMAAGGGVVFVIGRTILNPTRTKGWFARFTINYMYRFLQKNCRSTVSMLQIPPGMTLQVGMQYEI
ncbi:hypothetical protein RJ639_008122 [Escallonia herrerae]|uniref:Potassium transporter n=1 Tax=Escallonia herrerae TaxID=1293975 RepID=A0AA88VVS5_9ASTE|nr:hypothetical protein RJ639_008122 [Escallonia herrerae]